MPARLPLGLIFLELYGFLLEEVFVFVEAMPRGEEIGASVQLRPAVPGFFESFSSFRVEVDRLEPVYQDFKVGMRFGISGEGLRIIRCGFLFGWSGGVFFKACRLLGKLQKGRFGFQIPVRDGKNFFAVRACGCCGNVSRKRTSAETGDDRCISAITKSLK